MPDPGRYFDALKRVDYRVEPEPWSWAQVADAMRDRDRVLCVVNSKRDAYGLFRLLDDPNALHLSTSMCPAHRRQVLDEIRDRLHRGTTCRVVSTQLVEAGVDLDFPCVMRATGPLDRIVQAAGRCNREGTMSERGEMIVFTPAGGHEPRGTYATAMAEATRILQRPHCDLHDPMIFDEYFSLLWQDCNLDANGIRRLQERLNYPETAHRFRMIADDTVAVVIRYGDPGPTPILRKIDYKRFVTRDDWRKLQPYTVNMFRHSFDRKQRDIRQVCDGLFEWIGTYDPQCGLSDDIPDPADLIT